MNKKSFLSKDKLLFSTALITSFAGYYRRSYAGCDIDSTNGGTHICSGQTDLAQNLLLYNNASVTATSDFNLDSPAGIALAMSGDGALSFTDVLGSSISSPDNVGLQVNSAGDDGSTPGSITLNISGDISTLGNASAILAIQQSGSSGDTDITINSTANIDSSGGRGIAVNNGGSGASNLKISGNVTGDTYGVYVQNQLSATGLAITTYFGSAVNSTTYQAIFVQNYNTTITSVLNISGDVKSTNSDAILISSGAANITLDGSQGAMTITGGPTATAITSSAGAANDTITVTGNVTIDGNVNMGGGTDSLTFNGTTLTLTNNTFTGIETLTISGDNTITGNLNLTQFTTSNFNSGATLNVNGTLTPAAGTFTVASGRTLGGNVTIAGNLTIQDGATISPGNSIGDIVVSGNADFTDATLEMEVSNTDSDTITATGSIDVDGATLNIIPLSSSGSATILTAGTTISANNLTTNLVGGGIATTAINGNSLSVIFANSSTLSAGVQSSVNSSILFSDTISDEMANSTFIKDRHFWIRGIYRNQNQSTQGTNFGFRNNNYGVALGSQFNVGDPSYKLGFALSTIHENLDVDANQGSKQGESVFAAIYATYNGKITSAPSNSFFTSLAFGFGYHDSESERLVSNLGVSSMATSSTNDMEVNSTLQTGFKFTVGKKENWYISPRVSASYIRTFADGFTEENGGDAALKVNDYSFDTVKFREVLKFGANKYVSLGALNIFPYAEFGLAQERTIGNRKIRGSFAVNNTEFVTNLSKNNRNFLTGSIGTDIKITADSAAFISYQRSQDFSDKQTRNDVSAGIRIRF
jgi:outer membrane autotransporter protein